MIQRIQSVYLLLVTGLLVAGMCFPVGQFVADSGLAYAFKPLGVTVGEVFHSTWGMFGILLLSAIIALCTILLYKNRILQVRMAVFNSILLVGFYATFLVFMFVLKSELNASFNLSWTLCIPAVAVVLNYLAIRAIKHDEVLVKAADRLR